jgi:predicted outer membrane repeat protein
MPVERGTSTSAMRHPPGRVQRSVPRRPRQRSVRLLGGLALAGVCLLTGVAAPAQAATDRLYAAPATAGAADCSTPADACSIATAVTTANAASVADSVEIALAGGTYALPSPSPTALSITFAGPSLTLTADGGTPVLDGMGAVRLLAVGATSTVTIDGLEIRAGLATGLGGAIQNSGTLTVKHTTFSGNTAGNGGALSNGAGATLTVEDTTFSANTTTGVGGGAILTSGATTVTRAALIDNTAPINGGAINVQSGATVTVTSSTFAGNTSGGLGGAMSNLGTLTVQATTITDNSASSGGAIATGNANVTFAADIITAQTAGGGCDPANTAVVDGGYNLDVDGTCLSPTAPATGSHNGQTAYGTSTYGEVLDAYLDDAPADNGGSTQTVALRNTPDPATTLANPAYGVVPATFDLPVAVDGVASACAVPDQRGVVPVVGADCDIGAYLLQATQTALALPAATVEQSASVTFTATVTPAPGGGTVAFDDGAGNPATAHCAAQSVVRGTATCTVSYASLGAYRVTASYSGDGAMNSFVPSTSTTQTVVVVAPAPAVAPVADAPAVATPDRTPPRTTIRRVTSVKQPITLRGSAADAGSVRRVRVSVARHVGLLCRFLRPDHTFAKARSCDKTSYLSAHGRSSWSLTLPSLPHGRYTIWTRGIDAAGNVERKGRGQNLLVLRIPSIR